MIAIFSHYVGSGGEFMVQKSYNSSKLRGAFILKEILSHAELNCEVMIAINKEKAESKEYP